MLHEVLLALMGAPGYVIREGTDCFELNPGVAESFLHPSEVALVAKISGLGYHYKALERYTQSVLVGMLSFEPQPEAEPSSPAAPPPTRIYTRAVAAAVDELLQLYCDAVADAESEFLEDHALPLTHLQYLLRDQAVSLPAVHALVQRIESRGLRGGKIIDEVQKSSFSGVPAIEAAMARILSSAHELLLNHMIGWMVHGDISELSHHEFFVKDALLDRARQGSQVGANSEPIHEWHNRFSLRLDMLPGCIPLAVAEKIVFIGKAMRVLSQRSQLVSLDDKRQFTASLDALLRDGDAGIGDSNSSDDGGAGGEAARQSEGKADAAVAAPATVATRRISFKPIELSCTISALRGTAAKLLWQLVVQDSNLLKPLHAMRDYYLLAKGDFFQYFIQECLEKNLLGQQPRPAGSGNLSAELKKLWQVAATNSGVEEDDDFQRLSVELRTPAKGSADVGGAASSSDTWRQLSLSMEPAWPLDLLLSEPMQSRYNELFPLLFTVKRVQMALHAVWMPLVQLQKTFIGQRSELEAEEAQKVQEGEDVITIRQEIAEATEAQVGLMGVLLLRRHMGFVIDNLQHYFQVDVIDAAFSKLVKATANAADFEGVVTSHAEFLTVTSAQCFLHQRVITQAIDMLLESSTNFCQTVHTTLRAASTERLASFIVPDVERIAKGFESQVRFLFKVLNGARLQQSAPHLARLLLRLDFSGYYSG